jgi:glycosyltransferase involved in cell wall biosynthesis
LRIGLDARCFFVGNPSARVWVRNIYAQLVAHHPRHQVVLFLRTTDRRRDLRLAPGAEARFSARGNGLLSNTAFLPRAARQAGVDVLVSQYFSAPLRSVRQIAVVHDVIFRTDARFFTRAERCYFAFIRPLLRFSDAIVTVSGTSREDLQRLGFVRAGQPISVVPNGVDRRFFGPFGQGQVEELRRRRELPARFVLYVGRLNARKNIPTLVRAVASLADPDLKLVLCGRRSGRRDELARCLADPSMAARVVTLDDVTEAELPLLYRAATVFAYVSHREGFGMPPLEAMASGVPVVVSRRPTFPEVCGDAAVYVDPEQPASVAAGIGAVLSDPALRASLVQRGLARSRAFDWKTATDQLVALAERIQAS